MPVQPRSHEILNNARTKVDEEIVSVKQQKKTADLVLTEQQDRVKGLAQKLVQLMDARRQIDTDIGPPRGNQPT